MNRIFFVILMLVPLIATAQNFKIQTTNGSVNFTYFDGTTGTLENVSSTIDFDLSDLSKGSISGSVNVATIDTQNKLRNKHLKGKDYFDVENYPKMTFRSTSIVEEGGEFTIKGKLKIKSTEKDVIFSAIRTGENLVFSTNIYGLDFDVATSKKREKTNIEISVVIPM